MTTNNPERLVAYLRDWLWANKKDVLWLARESGISSPSLYDLMNGKTKNPKPETLQKIAAVMSADGDPTELYRLAGMLPEGENNSNEEAIFVEMRHILARIPVSRWPEALRMLDVYSRAVETDDRRPAADPHPKKARGTA